MVEIKEQTFSIIVKTGARRTPLLCYNKERNAYLMEVAAVPMLNKANQEITRFLTKKLGKKVRVIKGRTSRKKMLQALPISSPQKTP